jgi:DNA-binding LytR/AlgR family response regulator
MRPKYLYLNSRDEFFRIDISKIVYFEADGNYTHIVLNNKMKGSVSMNLSHMQQLLTDSLHESAAIFARIGKSYIINLTYVYQIAILRQKLVLSDGENFDYTLNISKDALKALRDLYVNHNSGAASVIEPTENTTL